jgi:DNA-binding LytR/AlgR family response regulator
MYKIAICDDENKILKDLLKVIKSNILNLNVSAEYFDTSDSEELLRYLENEEPHILFLDINMPKYDGMDIGEFLINKESDTILIFVTSYDELVYQSFKYHPFGFIRKSHFNEEIYENLKSAIKILEEKKDTLTIKSGNELIKIEINKIKYIEAEQNYVIAFTDKCNYRFRETLGNLEKELAGKGFIRTHRGYMVNQKWVFIFNSKEIKLEGGDVIPIGRSYSEEVKKMLMKFMR